MITRHFKILFILLSLFSVTTSSLAQDEQQERFVQVAMRMIGHRLLLSSGDSVSRVLPIEKDADRYKIQFESEFELDPEELVDIVDDVVQETKFAGRYIVEVEKCDSGIVVYSYEARTELDEGLIPCKTRPQPTGCYSVLVTLFDAVEPTANLGLAENAESLTPTEAKTLTADETKQTASFSPVWIALLCLLLVGGIIYFWTKKRPTDIDPDLIILGQYQFDKRNMELSYKGDRVELTSKEADLLFLLHTSANTTLEREVILKVVWGDEGDYVGRTLDVFISKLRKKLEADSSLKIVNIRGVGYKLVMNG